MKPQKSRWSIRIPATEAEVDELTAAAKAERRTIGIWLLELGLQRARRTSFRRPKPDTSEAK